MLPPLASAVPNLESQEVAKVIHPLPDFDLLSLLDEIRMHQQDGMPTVHHLQSTYIQSFVNLVYTVLGRNLLGGAEEW